MEVPDEYKQMYDLTWRRFADLVPKICNTCLSFTKQVKKDFDFVFRLLRASNIHLSNDDAENFGKTLTAANTLLTSINDC